MAIASIPSQKIQFHAGKEKIFITLLLRLILDNAGNVDEAIALAKKYDVFDKSIHYISHHFLIADKNGHSVIIEYQNGDMQFIKNTNFYQILTNSYVKDIPEDSVKSLCWRYKILSDELKFLNGKVNDYDAMNLLSKVSGINITTGSGTQWSVIYNLTNLTIDLVAYRNFNFKYVFKINE